MSASRIDDSVKEVRQGHGGGVMVWGGITDEDRTEMIIVNGNLNAERYINREFSIAVNVPLVNVVERMSARNVGSTAHYVFVH